MTEAQSNALDAYVDADAAALVAAKVALAHCVVTESAPTLAILERFKTALNFYSTPQLAKIVDAQD